MPNTRNGALVNVSDLGSVVTIHSPLPSFPVAHFHGVPNASGRVAEHAGHVCTISNGATTLSIVLGKVSPF
jgi:hypothetical protein